MRHRPNVVHRMSVSCQSDRHGARPILIVLHDTEGANVPNSSRDLVGLGNFFDNLATQASSHVGVDEDGNSARYVPDSRKAWTQAFFNPWCLSVEQIGFASQNWQSKAKNDQLHETARWIAHWNKHYGIPIQLGDVTQQGTVSRHGVVQHRRLGQLGGGHVDIGEDYPMHRVLELAAFHRRFI